MNKDELIKEIQSKLNELEPEYRKVTELYDKLSSDLFCAKRSHSLNDKVEVYENSGNHGCSTDLVGKGVIIEVISYGQKYKVKLDNGEVIESDHDLTYKSW